MRDVQLAILLLCIPTSCFVVSLNVKGLFADAVSHITGRESWAPSTERELARTYSPSITSTKKMRPSTILLCFAEPGKASSETCQDNHDKIVSFKSYTNTSRWRPKIVADKFDEYDRKVVSDVGNWTAFLFELGAKSLKNATASSHGPLEGFVIAILTPVILVPFIIPLVVLAIPVILVKNLTWTMLPAIAVDSCLKVVLSAAFVLHHPISVIRIVTGGIGKMIRGKSTSSKPEQ